MCARTPAPTAPMKTRTRARGTILIVIDDDGAIERVRAAFRGERICLQRMSAACPAQRDVVGVPAATLFISVDLSLPIVAFSIREFRRRYPGVPTVLATRMSVDNLIHLRGLIVSDVVNIAEPWHKIVSRVAVNATGIDLSGFADIIRSAPSLDPILRHTLAAAFELWPRTSTGRGLARRVGVPISTLRRHYDAVRRGTGIRLTDLLHAIQLADVATARGRGGGLLTACRGAGIDKRTAAAAVARLDGYDFDTITADITCYRQWLLQHVVARLSS